MQNTNITFHLNVYYDDLVVVESNNNHNRPYTFCLFQYTTMKNVSTITPADYTIRFTENYNYINLHSVTECKLTFNRFNSHCKWLPTSVFSGHSPGLINQ